MRGVEHTDWGADCIVLLHLYRSLVCSKLDYGCVVYGLASQSVLKQLDQGIRACKSRWGLSAHLLLKVSVEAHEPSLTSCHLKLSLNYVLKLKSLPENPAYSCVFEPENIRLFEESVSKKFHLSASTFYHTRRNPDLT